MTRPSAFLILALAGAASAAPVRSLTLTQPLEDHLGVSQTLKACAYETATTVICDFAAVNNQVGAQATGEYGPQRYRLLTGEGTPITASVLKLGAGNWSKDLQGYVAVKGKPYTLSVRFEGVPAGLKNVASLDVQGFGPDDVWRIGNVPVRPLPGAALALLGRDQDRKRVIWNRQPYWATVLSCFPKQTQAACVVSLVKVDQKGQRADNQLVLDGVTVVQFENLPVDGGVVRELRVGDAAFLNLPVLR